ncbi:MAG: transcription antitermination factor NusB [Candidatus Peribacteraceae bacterium]|nr:transcription antitermination factor NusB [Candidatus Peribacteraceae bacterium]MBP9851008.1 transcription antitermination factor NusB [Candidatus Peribacteraceae bacterium]
MPSRRRLARVCAMQTVFEVQARNSDADASLARNIAELGGPSAVDTDFSRTLVTGVLADLKVVQEAIQAHAPQWPWERMDSITRCILLIGAYELLHAADVPPAVVMNEAIEVAKEYGTEESAKFVNGVLNALAHRKKG